MIINKGKERKKGRESKGSVSISIVFLVLMALLLCAIVLAGFIVNNGKIKAYVGDSRFLENVYVQENKEKYEMRGGLEGKVIESYNEIGEINVNGFSQSWFDNLISGKISEKMDKGEKVDVENEVVLFSKEIEPIQGSLAVKSKEKKWVWGLIPVENENVEAQIGAFYKPRIRIYVDLNSLNLEDVGVIVKTIDECKISVKDNIEGCVSGKIKGYNVSMQGGKLFLESKDYLLVNGNLGKVKLVFVL